MDESGNEESVKMEEPVNTNIQIMSIFCNNIFSFFIYWILVTKCESKAKTDNLEKLLLYSLKCCICKYLSSELSEIFRGLISKVKLLVILYELVEIWKRFDQPSLWIFPVNFGFTVTKQKCNLFQIIWLTDSVNSRLRREVRLQERI